VVARSVSKTLPSPITCDQPSAATPSQRVVQVGSLHGEGVHTFGPVPVCRRTRDTEPGTQRRQVLTPPKPRHHKQRLTPACQGPAALTGAARPARGGQQPGQIPDQFSWDIEHGTIGNHVGPSPVERTCGETSSTEGSTSPPAPPHTPAVRVSPYLGPTSAAEITSVNPDRHRRLRPRPPRHLNIAVGPGEACRPCQSWPGPPCSYPRTLPAVSLMCG
jgi:hypothetical protein